MKPSILSREQIVKVLKVMVYAGLSAAIAAAVAAVASNPLLFGPLTPIVNVLLVLLKQVFTTP